MSLFVIISLRIVHISPISLNLICSIPKQTPGKQLNNISKADFWHQHLGTGSEMMSSLLPTKYYLMQSTASLNCFVQVSTFATKIFLKPPTGVIQGPWPCYYFSFVNRWIYTRQDRNGTHSVKPSHLTPISSLTRDLAPAPISSEARNMQILTAEEFPLPITDLPYNQA